MKVYLLFYDEDFGNREAWNTFYTPCEAFTGPLVREKRKAFVLLKRPDVQFHELDLDIDGNFNFPVTIANE